MAELQTSNVTGTLNVSSQANINGVLLLTAPGGVNTQSFAINTSATTGTANVSFSGNSVNYPGVSTRTGPAKWIPIVLDGVTYYLPAWQA